MRNPDDRVEFTVTSPGIEMLYDLPIDRAATKLERACHQWHLADYEARIHRWELDRVTVWRELAAYALGVSTAGWLVHWALGVGATVAGLALLGVAAYRGRIPKGFKRWLW